MKRTTIHVKLYEDVWGVVIEPFLPRKHCPSEWEIEAWNVVANDQSGWFGRHVDPKDGEMDGLEWHKLVSKRITQLFKNRCFHTSVRTLESVNGVVFRWTVTVFWDKPKEKFDPSEICQCVDK